MPTQANNSTSASPEEVGAGSAKAGPAPVDPAGSESPQSKPNPAVEAFHRITQDAAEIKEYAGYYVAAKIDGFRRSIRNLGLYAALGVLGLIAAGAIVATAVGLIVVGIAQALTSLFGGRAWLGEIVTGVLVLAIIAAAAWYMMNKLTGSWRSQTLKSMKSENNPNASASATTSTSAPPKAKAMDPQKTSEADFIAQQQQQAKAAISQTLADMKHAVAQGANVREWTRQHPWILMGAAAVAGVVAGRLVTPSKEEKLKDFFEEKWEKIKEKLTPAAAAEAAPRSSAEPQPEKPSMLGTVMRETMKAVGPALVGLITSMMDQQREQAEPGNGHNGNGHHGRPEPTETAPED